MSTRDKIENMIGSTILLVVVTFSIRCFVNSYKNPGLTQMQVLKCTIKSWRCLNDKAD